MTENCLKLEGALTHFENKPFRFQEAFCNVFGVDVRDEKDVFDLTADICELKWEKLSNGRVIRKHHIYKIRGDEVILSSIEKNKHHWPPSSRGGRRTLRIPDDFHESWHIVFMNLYKDEELDIFLNYIFSDEKINDFMSIRKTIDRVRKEAKGIKVRRK